MRRAAILVQRGRAARVLAEPAQHAGRVAVRPVHPTPVAAVRLARERLGHVDAGHHGGRAGPGPCRGRQRGPHLLREQLGGLEPFQGGQERLVRPERGDVTQGQRSRDGGQIQVGLEPVDALGRPVQRGTEAREPGRVARHRAGAGEEQLQRLDRRLRRRLTSRDGLGVVRRERGAPSAQRLQRLRDALHAGRRRPGE